MHPPGRASASPSAVIALRVVQMLQFVSSSEDFIRDTPLQSEKPYPVLSASGLQKEVPDLQLLYIIDILEDSFLNLNNCRLGGCNLSHGVTLDSNVHTIVRELSTLR